MKTNQEMTRYIDSFSVVQRTSDGILTEVNCFGSGIM